MSAWQSLPMRYLSIADSPTTVIRARLARRFRDRLRGLMGASEPPAFGEGLLLVPGGAIHTFGLCFPIAVIHLDGNRRVLARHGHVPPRRILFAPRRTRCCLEMRADDGEWLRPGCQLIEEALSP